MQLVLECSCFIRIYCFHLFRYAQIKHNSEIWHLSYDIFQISRKHRISIRITAILTPSEQIMAL